jgi:hypothetical protein
MEAADLAAVGVPGRHGDYLAKTREGEATFLLRGSGQSVVKPPLRLRHVEVDYGSRCCVREEARDPVDGKFITIRCTDVDGFGLELFVRTVEALTSTLPVQPSNAQTEALIGGIVELFRSVSQPPRRSVKGLWAELFIIDRVSNTSLAVEAWHAESDEKFDFVAPTGYVEVKATEQAVVIHEFSLAQLRGPTSGSGNIVSVRLRRAAGGTGVLALARRIADRLPGQDLRAKIWGNVVQSLGSDFAELSDVGFDERFAEESVTVVAASLVPCISTPLPLGVVDARVSVDFSTIPPSARRDLSALNGVFNDG